MDRRILAVMAVLVMVSCIGSVMMDSEDSMVDAETTHTSYSGKCGTSSTVPSWSFVVDGSKLTISRSGTVGAISTWTIEKIDGNDKAADDTTKASDVVKSFDLTIDSNSSASIGTVFAGTTITKISSFGKVTSIPEGAFKGCTSLSSVTLTGVTTIGKEAFSGCTSLASVTITSSVTTISESAFKGCSALTTITVPNTVTSVGKGVFENCTTLATVKWGKVAAIPESSFKGCSKLVTIDFGTATTISKGAFENCVELTSVTMSTSMTTISDAAFKGCSKLATVDLSNVTSLSHYAFEGCTKLSTFKTGTGNTKYTAVNNVLYEIDGSKNKTSIYMNPNASTGIVRDIDKTVTKIHSDYSSVVYVIDITRYSNLKSFEPYTGMKSIGIMYCTQGLYEDVSANYSNGTFTMAFRLQPGWSDDNCKVNGTTTPMTQKDGIYTVTVKCTAGVGYKVLPVGVENVTKAMLKDRTNLDNFWKAIFYLDADEDPESKIITSIRSYKCEITGVDPKAGTSTGTLRPTYNILGVECTLMKVSAANDYTGLVNLNIEGDVTIDSGTFRNILGLKTVEIDGLKVVPQELFRGCLNLQSVVIDNCERISQYAFDSCLGINSVNLGNTKAVDDNAFSGCSIEYVVADHESSLRSADGLFIIRCDNEGLSYRFIGHEMLMVYNATGYSSITVTTETPKTLGAESGSVTVYRGGMTVIDITGLNSIGLKPVSGTNSQKCLVTFYTAGGTKVDAQEVPYGGKLTAVPDPGWDGYTFKGWFTKNYTELGPVDTTKAVTESFVYRAYWEKDASSTNLHIYGLTGIVVALVASVALLAYHRFR